MVVLNLEKAYGMSKYDVSKEDVQERLGIGEDGYRALAAGDLEVTLDMLDELSDLFNLVITDLIDYETVKFGVLDCTARRLRGRQPKVMIDIDFHLRTLKRSMVSSVRLVHTGAFEVETGGNLGLDLRFVVNFRDVGVAAYMVGLNEEEKAIVRKVLQEYVSYAIDGVFTISMYKKIKVSIVGI